ncbi:hypothetical protein C8R43DRAFT_609275 [Mycena crocata]|nr:hypothetical protein C8R43DRAFT_609275 [Mycena crocata]
MLPAPEYLARYKFSSIQDRDDSIMHRVEFPIQASRLITPSQSSDLSGSTWRRAATSVYLDRAEPSVAFGRLVPVQARCREFLNIGNGWEVLVPRVLYQTLLNIEPGSSGILNSSTWASPSALPIQFSFKLRLPWARIARAARELQHESFFATRTD